MLNLARTSLRGLARPARPATAARLAPVLCLLLAPAALAQAGSGPSVAAPGVAPTAAAAPDGLVFDHRAAEHLLNRAGFGATPAEVDAAVAAGLDATLERLVRTSDAVVPRQTPDRLVRKDGADMGVDGMAALDEVARAGGRDAASEEQLEAARKARNRMRRADRLQLSDYTVWWFDTMASGEEPLRDRMTLFWHGYFTSSQQDVKSSYQMIEQNQLLRSGALGSFRELLHGVAKDPAMLEYLDNDENKKREPNENFAREVMELFTLGEGHYTEDDIKEAARAFTGWRSRESTFVASSRQHDRGEKTVLGVTGGHDGADVLDILLDQERCAVHVTGRIVTYLEGVAPEPGRLERLAAVLRDSDYEVGALLDALFRDPAFYRPEVVGQRVAGPVDLLVGMARRLEVEPPEAFYLAGSELLGQKLFYPPSVKGWDEGLAWITTASLMQRGNLAGILVGAVDVSAVTEDLDGMFAGAPDMDDMEDMAAMAGDDLTAGGDDPAARQRLRLGAVGGLRTMSGRWNPNLGLAADLRRAGVEEEGAAVDHLADRLLAVELGADTRAFLVAELGRLRGEARAEADPGPVDRQARFGQRRVVRRAEELALRRFVHLLLSLPEAQLH